jgi:hypothetical protein
MQFKQIEQLVKEHSGHTAPEIYQQFPTPPGIQYQVFEKHVQTLIVSNKAVKDREGNICWIYNPELVKKYLLRPELLIK